MIHEARRDMPCRTGNKILQFSAVEIPGRVRSIGFLQLPIRRDMATNDVQPFHSPVWR